MILSSLDVLSVFWRATWQAAMLAAVVFVLGRVFERSLSASAKTLLWTLPILRLLVLIVPASSLSVFNAVNLISRFEEDGRETESTVSASIVNSPSQLPLAAAVYAEPEFSSQVADVPLESTKPMSIAPPVATGTSRRSVTLADGMVAVWMFGVVVVFTRYLVGRIALRKLIVSGQVVALDELLPIKAANKLTTNIARRVRCIVVEDNLGPAVTGMIRPVILLPRQIVQSRSPDELKMVVMHELEHIRRHDTTLMFIAQLATIVHWCNPLVYWLKRRVQAQAEMAVDASTLLKLGVEKVNQYAELLFEIASVNKTPADLLSMARRSSTFRQRIEQLADIRPRTPYQTFMGAMVVLVIAMTGLSDATSQELTPAPTLAEAVTEQPAPITESMPESLQESQATTGKPVHVTSPDARTITGQVVDSEGKGVPNATLFCLSWNFTETEKTNRRILTDQNGNFALPYPSKLEYFDHLYTWVYAEGFGLRVVGMHRALKSERDTENVSIPLPPRATTPTRVQVLDSQGAPVAGMLVYPSRIEMPNGPFLANEPTGVVSPIPNEILESLAVRTDKDGVALFDHFPDWSWDGFRCRSVEHGEQEFGLAKSSDTIKLQLSPVGSIRGRIAADDLARFRNFGYSITTTSKPDTPENVSGVATGQINEHGEFHVPAIVAGQLAEFRVFSLSPDIQLVCDDYRSQKVLPNTSLELKLTAPPTVAVSGVVLTSDTRQPVSNARISYSRPGSPHDRVCKTDDKGEFSIHVVPGKIHFQMFAIGEQFGRSGRYSHARKFPDQIEEATQLEVLLPANKQVKGKLQDAAGRPIANQKVARHLGGPFMPLDGLATTDAQGNFEMFLDYWPLSADGYWCIVDKVEYGKPAITVVKQMSNTDDFFVLERSTVPVQPPKNSFRR